jgi:D-xylose transport system permease protein
MSTVVNDSRAIKDVPNASGRLGELRRRIGQVELGSLPVVLGLIIIWLIFQAANDKFLTPLNLTNLMLQAAAVGTISVGVVLILMLGEIDLSVGWVSGLCAAVMAVLNVKNGVPGPIAMLVGLIVGLLIGWLQGTWITRLRVPSFIVTLAGFLAWQGALLFVLGNTGTVNLRDPFILSLAGTFYPAEVGWAIGVLFVGAYVAKEVWERRRRLRAGLIVLQSWAILGRAVLVAAGVLGTVAILNSNRGLPSAVAVFIGIIILFDLLTKHTVFGMYVYAVGGNGEVARRASVNVDRVRVTIFMLASMLAAAGGILAASRLLAVNQNSGSSDTLLNAIAAAVIGGTSLFGGRGSIWSALLGALVIFSISNGMDLLALPSPLKFMVTGAVLLGAVTIDAVVRHRREIAGQ